MSVDVSTETGKAIVLYDGSCPLCRKSVAILKRLDWLKRLSYRDARDLEHLPQLANALDPDRLLEEMHVVTPNGQKAYAGFRAFRWMAGRLPLLWLLWPLLFIPGVPWLGHKLYRWIARHRYHLVPCRDGACALPPPTKQSGIPPAGKPALRSAGFPAGENPKPDATETA